MQQKKSKEAEYIKLKDRELTVKPEVLPSEETGVQITYNKLNKNVFQFFREREFQQFEAFKEGYNKSVSEDYDSIDLLCNLNDLVYDYIQQNQKLTPQDKINLKNVTAGVQMISRSYSQYLSSKKTDDKIFVAMLSGYIIKLLRNYYHD